MDIIIDYGSVNIGSLKNMIKKIGKPIELTHDQEMLNTADHIILPGVGSFNSGIQALIQDNLFDLIKQTILINKTPVLGICLGMQILSQKSDEGTLDGLKCINAEVKKFNFKNMDEGLRIPHMGWNSITLQRENVIFADIDSDAEFYFAHSYHVEPRNKQLIVATTHYGL